MAKANKSTIQTESLIQAFSFIAQFTKKSLLNYQFEVMYNYFATHKLLSIRTVITRNYSIKSIGRDQSWLRKTLESRN